MIKLNMKKGTFLSVILFLIILFPLVTPINDSINDSGSLQVDSTSPEITKKNLAYDCLETKIDEAGCTSLPTEEKIFSLLAVGQCSTELSSDAQGNRECWPKESCRVKTTAQAIWAYDKAGLSSDNAQEWVISRNQTPKNIDWFLEIDSNSEAHCSISYSGNSYSFLVQEDKKLSSNAGSCLIKAQDGYWYRISSECYGKEFEISCDQSFLTSLLFKKKDSSVINVPENPSTASAEGTTTEKVDSYCFANAGSTVCDYEGSLWATTILNYLGYDITSYVPYLISMEDENEKYLPGAFLYSILAYEQYRSETLAKQKASKYWEESSVIDAKFYDTAIALLPFVNEMPDEKQQAINWLIEDGVQDKSGCWKGNIRNTAFLLSVIWPRQTSIGETSDLDCEDSGYFCMPSADCQGSLLTGYDCAGVASCCSQEEVIGLCSEQGGVVCSSAQTCQGQERQSSDTVSFGTCCVGACTEIPETPECELQGGICSSTCASGYEDSDYSCNSFSQSCCMRSSSSGSSLWLWIIILGILIVIIVLAIVFRNKLSIFWMRIKSKFKKGDGNNTGFSPRGPPRPGTMPVRNLTPSRALPHSGSSRNIIPERRPQQNFPLPKKTNESSEMDDVLKKLRDMGK